MTYPDECCTRCPGCSRTYCRDYYDECPDCNPVDHHCGRMDVHAPHAFRTHGWYPDTGRAHLRRTFVCVGPPSVVEGGAR